MRDPSTSPVLGELSPEGLVAHRELQAIRNPSPERLRKLAEARAALAAVPLPEGAARPSA